MLKNGYTFGNGSQFSIMISCNEFIRVMKAKKKASEETNKMEDDPLKLMIQLTGYEISKNVLMYRFCCMIILMYSAVFDILPLYRVFNSGNGYKICLMGVFLHIPSLIGTMLGAVYCHDMTKYREVLRSCGRSIGSQGEKIKGKILHESKILNIFCLCLCIYSPLVNLTSLSFERERELICQISSLLPLLEEFHMSLIIFVIRSVLDGILLNILIMCPAHALFHLRFQYILLNADVEDLIKPRGVTGVIDDMVYQNYIYFKLTQFVEQDLKIRRIFESLLTGIQDVPMAVASSGGLLSFVTCFYIIIAEVSPQHNVEAILCIILILVIFLALCFCGQLLRDQSIKFHNLLCQSPWNEWNEKNRNCLLIILPNTAKPLKMSCFGLYDLDYRYILSAIRVAYSLLAVTTKVRQ